MTELTLAQEARADAERLEEAARAMRAWASAEERHDDDAYQRLALSGKIRAALQSLVDWV